MTNPLLPRCLCCDRPLSPVAQHGALCYGCLDGIIGELLALADLRPGEVATVADILRMCGALTMAAIVTRVPFSDKPTSTDLDRLSDE